MQSGGAQEDDLEGKVIQTHVAYELLGPRPLSM